MSTYSIKGPDMSRNKALAGMTVSSKGMNVTYNEDGYAVTAVNYRHQLYAQTSRSICAPSKEAALAGDSRTGYDGPDEDRTHFSDREFAQAVELRRRVAEGKLSEKEANEQLEEIRRMYGYSFGAGGNQYAAIELPKERPEEAITAQGASVTAQGASVRNAAPPRETDSETEQLRESWQTQLREQQQRRTVYSELEELRVKDMIRVDVKGKASDALLELMDEDEDD